MLYIILYHVISQFLHVSFVSLKVAPQKSPASFQDLRADSKAQPPFSARRGQRCPSAEDEPEPAAEEFLDAELMGGPEPTGFGGFLEGFRDLGMPLR